MTTNVESVDFDARVRGVVGRILDVAPADLDEESRFVEVYGGDSMTTLDILAQLEREFSITLSEEELPRMIHLTAVREVVAETLAASQDA